MVPRRVAVPRWVKVLRWVAVAGYGGVLVAVPFAVYPRPVDPVLATLDPRLPAALPEQARVVAAAVALGCLAVTVVAHLARRRFTDAGEAVLLTVMALLAPPVLTFAVFFGAWHSLRHLTRLVASPGGHRPPASGTPDRAGRLDRRLVLRAGVGSVAATVAVTAVLAAAGVTGVHLLAVLVAGLLALTVPHAAAVAWFDRRRHPTRTLTDRPAL